MRLLWIGMVFFVAACATPQTEVPALTDEPLAELRGEAFYRERILMQPGTELVVELLDVTSGDAADIVGGTGLPVDGGGPFTFTIFYNPNDIHPDGQYAVLARLELNGRTLFQSRSPTSVLADGDVHEPSILMVSTVQSMFDRPIADIPEGLTGERWIAEDIGGAGVMDMLQSALEFSATGQVSGNTGCNQLNGRYHADGAQLRIGPLATTRRGCTEAIMRQEQRFLGALETTAQYRIDEMGGLALLAADGAVLVRLVAEN